MPKSVAAHLALLKSQAEAGVDYRPRAGALCPACGQPAKIVRTFPWDGDTRIRYHRCQAPGCILASIKQSIKSVQADG
jgi:hypothetical protein